MAIKIKSAAFTDAGRELLKRARQATVPYTAGGMTLAGMDCQGLVEYLLIRCGVPKKACNLAGSNAHWRKCVWTGTPEACKKAFGVIPEGALLFIWEETGAPARYGGDGRGNAEHMGVYLGGCALHASSSRGKVAESKFEGKTIPNGGWNRVGLAPWVDYGLDNRAQTAAQTNEAGEAVADTASFFPVKKGCLGGAVRRLQAWLNDLDFTLAVDGDFGSATENAVRYFQRTHELEADGYVGKQTWAALARARAETIKGAKG